MDARFGVPTRLNPLRAEAQGHDEQTGPCGSGNRLHNGLRGNRGPMSQLTVVRTRAAGLSQASTHLP
jgi:hypothetical protein